MKDRRTVVALVGAALGISGAVLALAWDPIAALVAAAGAVAAAAVAVTAATALRATPTPAPTAGAGADADAADEQAEAAIPAGVGATATAPVPAANNGAPASPLLIDPVTGLFSEDYFGVAIEARVAAARRHLRPVGVVVLDVVHGLREGTVRPADPVEVAHAVRETLREADTACRRADGRFALLLEDTPENGAIWTVERIRRFMAEKDPTLTLWAGIACYPAHAFSSDQLVSLADQALATAREWHQDRIEVATAE